MAVRIIDESKRLGVLGASRRTNREENDPLMINEDDSHGRYGALQHHLEPETSFKLQAFANVVMFVYYAAFMPSVVLAEQYLYTKISEKHSFNETAINGTCGSNGTARDLQERVQSESSHWMILLKVRVHSRDII